jgi:3-deoxy-D-manno-octulosonic-acid transferase
MHGASVGEVLSLLPLITTLKEHHPDISVLVTSGTVTSAALMAERLGSAVIHQFLPLDHPLFYPRFFNHWQPDAVYWTESDLWLGILGQVKKRALPAFLINARMSAASYHHWRKMPAFIRRILSTFSVIIACDPVYQGRFESLSGQPVVLTPDLKYDTLPPPFSEDQRQALQSMLGTSPLWMAASTHDPEEAMILSVHERLRQDVPTLRLILAPRHPRRRESVKE